MFKNWKINQINKTVKNLQTCTVSLDLDTFTALVGQSVTLTAIVDPPRTYDINFKINGNVINPDPIPTDPSGIATLLLDSTGQPPGLYEFIAEVIGPVPNSCISAPLTGALTMTQCTGITIDTPGPIIVHEGDIVSISVTAAVTEQSVVEFRETTSGQRIENCIISPPGGQCIVTVEIPIGAPPGTFGVVAKIGNGPAQQCASNIVSVILEPTNICQWITSKGGWNNLRIFDIMTLVSAYLGQTNLGFAIAIVHIMGVIAYYLNNLSSGDSLTGCPST